MSKVKILKKKAENLWKQVVLLRDGKFCWVQRFCPEINIIHTKTIQLDHTISRKNKHLFLDPKNGIPICSACNMAKGFGNKSINRAIDNLSKQRDPKWFEWAVSLDKTCSPNVNFSRVWWLEEQIERLEKELDELKKGGSHGYGGDQ